MRLLNHVKLDILKNPGLKGLFDFKIESSGETGGFQGEGWAYNYINNGYLEFLKVRKPKHISIAFEDLLLSIAEKGYHIQSGFKGCFDFLDWIYFKRPGFKQDLPYEHIRKLAQRTFSLGVRASYGGKAVAYKYLDELDNYELDTTIQFSEYYENAASQISHLKYLGRDRKYKKRLKDSRLLGRDYPFLNNKRIFKTDIKDLKIYRKGDITIVILEKEKKCFFFLQKDLTRVSQMLRSISLIYEYFFFYPRSRGTVSKSITVVAIDMIEHIIIASRKLDPDKINNLCRAFNVAVFYWLAKIGADVTDRSVKEMEAKIEEENLTEIGDLDHWFNFIQPFKTAEQAELLHIYKFIYVGDFCLNSSMEKFRIKHHNPSKIADEDLYADFLRYRKLAFIKYYTKEKGLTPGTVKETSKYSQDEYEMMDINRLKIEDVDHIDITGCLEFVVRQSDVIKYAKDKVAQPVGEEHTYSTKHLDYAPIKETNYLAGFLLDEKMKDPSFVMNEYERSKEQRSFASTLRTACKPEAKKRDPRLFTMANRYDRLMISMIEDNIGDFIQGKNGVFIGLSNMEKKRMFRKFVSEFDTSKQGGTDHILISFDLKGFSPLMNPRVKEDMYNHWAEIFNTVQIKNAYGLFKDTVYMQRKYGFDTEYKLIGNDIEGFNARMNTDFHVDLMAFAVFHLQRQKLITSGARLAVLIDDGFLKLMFKDEVTKDEINKILGIIEKVYAAASLQISWDKTIVSKKSGIFLNEIVYNSALITPGIKSYMKIGPDKASNIMTFAEELNEIYSNAQGSINAGCPWLQAYYRYLKEIYKSRFSWDRRYVLPLENEVIRAITPVNLGGLGVAPLITLATNESQTQLSTNIGFLRAVGLLEPEYKKFIITIINQETKPIEAVSFLKNPGSFRILGRIIHNRRIDTHVRELVLSQSINPTVKQAFERLSDDSITQLYDMFKEIGSVDSNTISRAYNATPEALIDTIIQKFQRSTTFASLLPARVRFGIMALNVSDVKVNSRHWLSFN